MNDVPALLAALRELHHVEAVHRGAQHVRDADRGRVFWEGLVELFEIHHHRRAERAFGWCVEMRAKKTRVIVVLQIAPVFSALDAVRVAQAVRRRDGSA